MSNKIDWATFNLGNEHQIGTLGSDAVYEKYISTTLSISTNSHPTIAHGISNIGTVISASVGLNIGPGQTLLATGIGANNNVYFGIWTVTSTVINLYTATTGDFSGKCYARLVYTKS